MLFAVVMLSSLIWDGKSLCAFVAHKQTEGWTLAQIEQLARDNKVAEKVIRWAKKNC